MKDKPYMHQMREEEAEEFLEKPYLLEEDFLEVQDLEDFLNEEDLRAWSEQGRVVMLPALVGIVLLGVLIFLDPIRWLLEP